MLSAVKRYRIKSNVEATLCDRFALAVQGIRAVVATAMGGHMLADGGPAAAQLAEVMAELQCLPRNGHLGHLVGPTGPKALHRSRGGAPLQSQPLQVATTGAVHALCAFITASSVPSALNYPHRADSGIFPGCA